MEDEERNEQQQGEETESRKLRSIERSNLRGARTRSTEGRGRRVVQKRRPEKNIERPKKRKKGKKKNKIIITFLILLAIVVIAMTTLFSSAKIDMTIASVELPIDGVFSAIREPAQSKDISYLRHKPYPKTLEATISNGTRERQNTRAEGTVMLYNTNLSGESLEIVNRTRLRSKSGKEYRLIGKQVIPGGKTVGGVFTPGTKEVKIEADGVGDEYNIVEKGAKLTIPGLAKYKEFSDSYALTKTTIVGGFSGERLIPDKEEEKAVRQQLRRDIEKALRDEFAQSIDTNTLPDRVVFEDGIFIEYESSEEQIEGAVIVREKGTLRAVSFREAELAALLSQYAPASIKAVLPTKVDTMNLKMDLEADDEFDVVTSTEFSFRLSGSATLFWEIDKLLFLSDIAGKTRMEAESIIAGEYPQVMQVNTLSIFPWWNRKLPSKEKKIEVITKHELYGENS